ncbi:MAG: tripartite tricarboxylate transporter substrate-binding protein [Pseudomonadota bacterium]
MRLSCPHRLLLRRLLLAAACAAPALPALAQTQTPAYPSHEVRLVVPIQPNGIIDAVAKPVAEQLGTVMGQPVVPDYRPGALTITGSDYVAKAPGDGYTLLAHSRQLVNNVFIFRNIPFDARKDLVPVSLVARTGFLVVVNPALPVNTIAELIALAKAKPGQLKYASSGKASNQQMSVELFKQLSKTRIALTDFEGGGGAQDAVASGASDMGIFAQVAVMQMVKDGKLKVLATTGAKRSPVLPDVPTVAESGLPGYEFTSWVGIFAPRATPPALVRSIHASLVKTAAVPEFQAVMARQGAEVVMNTPQQFQAFMKTEFGRWGKVIQQAGIKPE